MEVLVRKVRVAFAPGIFEASAAEEGGKKKYNAKFILPTDHPQVGELKKIEEQVAADKWGAKSKDILKRLRATSDKHLVRDGSTQRADGFEDNLFFSASNDSRPSTFDRQRNPVTKEDGVIYSGCYVNAKIEVWAQDNQFGQRINAQLTGVQFVADGDSFGSGAKAATPDDFPDLEDGTEEDPFA